MTFKEHFFVPSELLVVVNGPLTTALVLAVDFTGCTLSSCVETEKYWVTPGNELLLSGLGGIGHGVGASGDLCLPPRKELPLALEDIGHGTGAPGGLMFT